MRRDQVVKNLKVIRSILQDLNKAGTLEPGQSEAAQEAVKALEHALKTRDARKIKAAVNDLTRVFIVAAAVEGSKE